jgi:hypothetical protein
LAEAERVRQSLLADAGWGDLLKTIIDRVELRPNGLRMILSLVPLTPAAAPPTPLAWLRNAPTGPKPDHVRALLDRLRRVREIGMTRDFLSPFGRNVV